MARFIQINKKTTAKLTIPNFSFGPPMANPFAALLPIVRPYQANHSAVLRDELKQKIEQSVDTPGVGALLWAVYCHMEAVLEGSHPGHPCILHYSDSENILPDLVSPANSVLRRAGVLIVALDSDTIHVSQCGGHAPAKKEDNSLWHAVSDLGSKLLLDFEEAWIEKRLVDIADKFGRTVVMDGQHLSCWIPCHQDDCHILPTINEQLKAAGIQYGASSASFVDNTEHMLHIYQTSQ
jgi:hypothetical protein